MPQFTKGVLHRSTKGLIILRVLCTPAWQAPIPDPIKLSSPKEAHWISSAIESLEKVDDVRTTFSPKSALSLCDGSVTFFGSVCLNTKKMCFSALQQITEDFCVQTAPMAQHCLSRFSSSSVPMTPRCIQYISCLFAGSRVSCCADVGTL